MMQNITEKQIPHLFFEFATSTGETKPVTFLNPITIISTHKVDEVLQCLEEVQTYVNEGYYAAGFLSYESAPAFHSSYKVKQGHKMPLCWFGIFKEPLQEEPRNMGSFSLSKWEPDVTQEEYRSSIQRIKEEIAKGITYQTNYTIRLQAEFQGDSFALFNKMKRAQEAKYCAYIHTGEYSVLSASPELFFHIEGDCITTRPMKGTLKRGKTFEEDQARSKWLHYSKKNRAENVMIVDLLRNDLGIVAETGSVSVQKLFEVEQYPTVHQMTSTVIATLKDSTELVDVLKALFPCGSITGAPKRSTMELIAELETAPREVYCGAIGFIAPNREAIFNVPIRTVLIENNSSKAIYGVGGGITWDSTVEDEYDEVLAKSAILTREVSDFQLLESLLLHDGNYFLLEEHLQRLGKSATYFRYNFPLEKVKGKLKEFAEHKKIGQWKVRLLLYKDGEISIEGQAISQMKSPKKVILATKPIDSEHLYLYHKTTNRAVYQQFQPQSPEILDVLLWNEKSELTEFMNGNVVVEMDGKRWTPPVSSGLLAGTFREHLLKEGQIHEKILTVEDIEKFSRVWFINSVRKWIEVEIIE